MSEGITANVAAEVRAEMARQRRSQRSVADALGVSQTYIWRRLTGDVSFDIAELSAVADFLGVPMGQFIERREQGSAA